MNKFKFLIVMSVLLLSTLTIQGQSIKEVEGYIKEIGIQHPSIVLKQFILESGAGTSNLARRYNNLFGFKAHTRKASFSTGTTKNGFAIYPDWKASVADYLIWQILYARDLSEKDYLKYLNSKYAPNQNYLKKLLGY